MGLCGEHNVTLSFLTANGRFLARVHGPVTGNVSLRRQQYRFADCLDTSAKIARSIITAKIANSRNVLMRAARENSVCGHDQKVKQVASYLGQSLDELRPDLTLDQVRGKEGEAANIYFDVFDHLITANKQDFVFTNRNRRPPTDNVNALLSFLYTLLVHDVGSALETVGLDPAVGFLHRDRPGRASLALDIAEEFRAYMADRLCLSLINRQQVKGPGFTKTESGAVTMDDATRKTVLVAWQKRKLDEITHPFINERIQIGLLPHVQAMLLARYIRGDLKGYPPFLWK
jgi:CRISPR-associated protein Cas1